MVEINKIEEIADDYTDYYPIGEYDKKGNLINIFEKVKTLNKENYIKSNYKKLLKENKLNLKKYNLIYF